MPRFVGHGTEPVFQVYIYYYTGMDGTSTLSGTEEPKAILPTALRYAVFFFRGLQNFV